MKKIIALSVAIIAAATAATFVLSCNDSEANSKAKKVVKATGYASHDSPAVVVAPNPGTVIKGGVLLSVKQHQEHLGFWKLLIDTSNDKSPDIDKTVQKTDYENPAHGDSIYLVIKNGKITDVFPVLEK